LGRKELANAKMRVTSGSWDGEKVILKDQVLEVRNVEGRLHLARNERRPDEWDPPSGRFRPRYESQAAAQRRRRPRNQRSADSRTSRRVATWPNRPAGSHCGGQEQPQPPQRFLVGRLAIFLLQNPMASEPF
jgi:hypothetical protein